MNKIYIFIAFIISQIIMIVVINNNNETKVTQLLNESNKLIQTQYSTVYNSFETLANTVFKGYINKDKIIYAFERRDRERLFNDLKEDYRYLESINFKQIHFHLPNNYSFLRMHKPSKFGDDLTKIRYSVDYVNIQQKPISGLEMGKVVPGFRYVYPLFNNFNKHLGSVETSFSVYAFAKQMEKTYNVHTHFLIHTEVLEEKVFKDSSNLYSQSLEHKDFKVLSRGNDKKRKSEVAYLKPIFDTQLRDITDKGIKTNEIFSIELELENATDHIHKIITFLPLKNIQNKSIGYFVVYHDDYNLLKLEEELFANYAIGSLIVILLFLFLYRQSTINETLSFRVGEQTAKLQEAAVSAEEHAAEIEMLNESLEDRIKVEVEKNADQERRLANQSKQAALGDMIGNIAHQWRQPLSAITSAATGMQLSQEVGMLKNEDFTSFAEGIVKNATYLSQTIDDFRDFISSEKKFETFNINESITKCLAIANSSINNHKLRVITNFEGDVIISNYNNELQQAVINIFNNAKDALKYKIKKEEDRVILIDTYSDEETAYLQIRDSAGGIPESIIDKVFEPYFTTKHQSQGTGLGLYMTHQIVCDSMHGSINLENVNFKYNEKEYMGAQFILSFKKDKCTLTKEEQ